MADTESRAAGTLGAGAGSRLRPVAKLRLLPFLVCRTSVDLRCKRRASQSTHHQEIPSWAQAYLMAPNVSLERRGGTMRSRQGVRRRIARKNSTTAPNLKEFLDAGAGNTYIPRAILDTGD